MNSNQIIIRNFIEGHPADAARILEALKIRDIVSFIKEIPVDLTVRIIANLERHSAAKCLEALDIDRSAKIIGKLPLEIAAVFIRRISKDLQEPLLNAVSKDVSNTLRRMLRYPEDTAAGLMNPLALALPEDITVKEALKQVQKRAEKASYYLYIVKRDETLVGVLNMRELMLASPKENLASVMHRDLARLPAEANFRSVLNHPGWMSYHTLPVVDRAGIFLGTIRYSTVRRIESDNQAQRASPQAIAASNALGDLYRIGLTGLIRSTSAGPPHRKEI